MLLEFANSHFGSVSQNIPEIQLRNLYKTENPLSPTGTSYVTRPVVQSFISFADNLRGIYYQQGFLNDDILAVAGEKLYRLNDETNEVTLLGDMPGDDECKFSSTIYSTAIISLGRLYIYDGTSIEEVSLPDNHTPIDVTSLNNYFVVAVKDSNLYYWINPGEVVIDPLSFASAEASADFIVALKATSDELWLIGATTTEVWAASGDADAPFIRISGRIFNLGCASKLSVCVGVNESLPALFWVTDSREVVLAQGAPVKISNDFIEEVLRTTIKMTCWFFRKYRNDFYLISTDTHTLVFDVNNNSWSTWSTLGSSVWQISAGLQKTSKLFGINLLNSPVLYLLTYGTQDIGTDWLVCELSGFVPYTDHTPLSCTSLQLQISTGFSSSYLNTPLVEIRWSDDGGFSWSNYVQHSLGVRGDVSESVEFRSLGLIRKPGRRFELRFSNSEFFRVDYAVVNKQSG